MDPVVKKFKAGSKYATRSICDHDCVISMTVVSRTTSTIVADVGRGELRTMRVAAYGNAESVKPWGRGSMMPIIGADDVVAA